MPDEDKLFVKIPELNPKTGKPPVLYLCRECGNVTGNRNRHTEWHRKLSDSIRAAENKDPDWPPLY